MSYQFSASVRESSFKKLDELISRHGLKDNKSYLFHDARDSNPGFQRGFFSGIGQSPGLGKLGRQGAICWLKKELSWRNGTFQFFVCQDRKLKFSASV